MELIRAGFNVRPVVYQEHPDFKEIFLETYLGEDLPYDLHKMPNRCGMFAAYQEFVARKQAEKARWSSLRAEWIEAVNRARLARVAGMLLPEKKRAKTGK